MLRTGCILLTIWTLLNLVPSLWIIVSTVFLDGNSPAIYQILSTQEVKNLTSNERTSINSVAVYANGLNVAFCCAALFVIWCGLYLRSTWAFACLVSGFTFAVLAGTLGDFVLGTVHPEINAISALILAVGFFLIAKDLFWGKQRANDTQ